MPFCTKCGVEIGADFAFCPKCGAATSNQAASAFPEEVSIFTNRVPCREILSEADKSNEYSALSIRPYFNDLLKEDTIGGNLLGITPPNNKGEVGHFGNGLMDVLLTQNFIAIASKHGSPRDNRVYGWKKSSGYPWGIIFPISELSSVTLNKCSWKMNFSNGNVQETEYWYLVIKLKNQVMPSGSSGWWPLDLSAYPDRKSFKYGFNAELNPCPKALWQPKERSLYPDAGDGAWYIGMPFDDNCDFPARKKLATALGKEISHYPNFRIEESAVITSNTHHQLVGATARTQGFAFSMFEME
jgi:hypothetical protein